MKRKDLIKHGEKHDWYQKSKKVYNKK